jgi:hypothetical protein
MLGESILQQSIIFLSIELTDLLEQGYWQVAWLDSECSYYPKGMGVKKFDLM